MMDLGSFLRTYQPELTKRALLAIVSDTIADIRRTNCANADTCALLRTLAVALVSLADTMETAIPVPTEIAEQIPA